MIPFKLHNNLWDLVIIVVLQELTGNFLLAGGWDQEFDTKPEFLIIKTPGLCSPSPGLCLSHSGARPSSLRLSFPLSLGLYPRVCAHSPPCPCPPLWLLAFPSPLPPGGCRCHCEWGTPLCSALCCFSPPGGHPGCFTCGLEPTPGLRSSSEAATGSDLLSPFSEPPSSTQGCGVVAAPPCFCQK